ncbi:hypothetical protein Bbelb_260320 [Branchiostoma belcheri]|nr:hypothetical protein Bbelb_260320 [Branchiostoma belcheri]
MLSVSRCDWADAGSDVGMHANDMEIRAVFVLGRDSTQWGPGRDVTAPAPVYTDGTPVLTNRTEAGRTASECLCERSRRTYRTVRVAPVPAIWMRHLLSELKVDFAEERGNAARCRVKTEPCSEHGKASSRRQPYRTTALGAPPGFRVPSGDSARGRDEASHL